MSVLQKLDLSGPLLGRGRLSGESDLNDHFCYVRFLQNEFELESRRRVGGTRSTEIGDLEKQELENFFYRSSPKSCCSSTCKPIPPELGSPSALELLSLSCNEQSGELPQIYFFRSYFWMDPAYRRDSSKISCDVYKSNMSETLTA